MSNSVFIRQQLRALGLLRGSTSFLNIAIADTIRVVKNAPVQATNSVALSTVEERAVLTTNNNTIRIDVIKQLDFL